MFQALKKRQARKKRIAELREYICNTYESEAKGAKTSKEKGEAYQIARSLCELEENELNYLRQENILRKLKTAPFEVPKEYWEGSGWEYKAVLTYRGEVWVRNELEKVWRTEVEFWFKLVLPVLALVLSIIALVRKH
jgi:hypothetical protein